MGSNMRVQEKSIAVLPLMFPSNRRKYVRVPPEYAYKCIIHVLRDKLELKDVEIKHLSNLSLGTNLGGKIGVSLTVHITPEGDISVLNIIFRYRKMVVLSLGNLSKALFTSI